jgi:hypothetical protein
VFYDIRWKEFRKAFDSILENNFDIGLHASYNACSSHERLEFEKENLESISGTKIQGLRHHYWSMGKDINNTLLFHYKAGFGYDSTVGFNDHPGFRRNIAYPFYPFDIHREFSVGTLQIPVFCMDGNLFYRKLSFDAAMEELKEYLGILKSVGGTAAIDWHAEKSVSQKGQYRVWGETYLALLAYLAEDSDAWVTSPDKFYQHMKNREASI